MLRSTYLTEADRTPDFSITELLGLDPDTVDKMPPTHPTDVRGRQRLSGNSMDELVAGLAMQVNNMDERLQEEYIFIPPNSTPLRLILISIQVA